MDTVVTTKDIQRKLMHISKLHRIAADAKISVTGIRRNQHMILMYLYRRNESVSQKEIAEHFDVSPAAITVSLKKLERDGYITRRSSKNDNRFNEIELNDKGKDIVIYSYNSFESIDNQTFEGITDEEKVILATILDKVINNLKNISGQDNSAICAGLNT